MPSRGTSHWGSLPQGAKDFERSRGVTPAVYNRWWNTPQTERSRISREARAAGYDSGLRFYAVQAQVRQHTGKKITPKTPPNKAARMMLKGSKKESRTRQMVPKLFDFSEFDHVEWENFLSP